MKIILIPCLGGGGAERQAINLLNAGVFDKIVLLENHFDYEIDKDKIENSCNKGNNNRYRRWKQHSLTIFNSSIALDMAVRCFQLPDSGDDW